MNQNHIFLPCFVLILHTAVILVIMFMRRLNAIKRGEIKAAFFKTYDMPVQAPHLTVQAARNFSNLFEAPTLFYVLCLFALVLKQVDLSLYISAWLFVIFRLIHSFIHITANKIIMRATIYGVSWLFLLFMALKITINII